MCRLRLFDLREKPKGGSDGILGQINYYPWENVRLSLQYTAYLKFNGSSSNYDGTGRDAQDNNTTYLLAWFVW